MDVLDTAPWETRAVALAAQLDAELRAGGIVLDPAWRHAFAETPRHRFVPRILNGGTVVQHGDPGWLEAVYANESLAQTRPSDTSGHAIASSSSSKPTVMAIMLEQLKTEPGHRVLEIGTGTAYNTALLAYRLGDQAVCSIDLDPELIESGRGHLADWPASAARGR